MGGWNPPTRARARYSLRSHGARVADSSATLTRVADSSATLTRDSHSRAHEWLNRQQDFTYTLPPRAPAF